MNAFFASVEQLSNPFIRNKPVGVGSAGYENAALLAISYEAKKRGVPKFARLKEAKRLCPDIVAVPFDPVKYYAVNRQIVEVFRSSCPCVEVYSIDECFMDITEVIKDYDSDPIKFAQILKQRILDEVGITLTSSVGIGPNKLLAKLASNWQKPNGLTWIKWEDRFKYLDDLPIEKLWGIGFRSTAKLNAVGIHTVKQLREIEPMALRDMVGGYYTRLVMLCNGEYYDAVQPARSTKLHKTMQHAHTLSEPTNDRTELLSYIRKQSERLGKRLRRHGQYANLVYLGLKPEKQGNYGWGSPTRYNGVLPLDHPTDSGTEIFEVAMKILDGFGRLNERVRLLAVGIGDLTVANQLLMDFYTNPKVHSLDLARDEIDAKFGNFTVRTGDILHNHAKESELTVEKEEMVFHPT